MTFKDALLLYRHTPEGAENSPTSFKRFLGHKLCKNCCEHEINHIKNKCLFDSSYFAGNVRAAERYEEWVNDSRAVGGTSHPFWSEDVR